MSTRAYTTGFTVHNPDLGSTVWSTVGTGLMNTTIPNGFVHLFDLPDGLAVSFVNDNAIPTASAISDVAIRIIAAWENESGNFAIYRRFSPGTQAYAPPVVVLLPSFNAAIRNATTDANGNPWTVANLFLTRFGVQVQTGNANAVLYITEITIAVTFTLPAPVVTTDPASAITVSSATLNATINPSGATSVFPMSHRFEWGTTTLYGNTTTLVTGVTGSASTGVTGLISGLSGNTTYHYRIVGINDDNTVNGIDRTFSTGGGDRAMMVF